VSGTRYVVVVYDGETTGRIIEGEKGGIEIDVPLAALKLAGKRLTVHRSDTMVETGETAETELPDVVDYLNAVTMDYTTAQFSLATAACAAALAPPAPATTPPAIVTPLPATVLPRLTSRRLRSVRGRIRVPLACASATPCAARLRIGTRTVTVRMKPGSRSVALLRPSRAQARRLRKGRSIAALLHLASGNARSSRRVTVTTR
jgi:hypothetical protein